MNPQFKISLGKKSITALFVLLSHVFLWTTTASAQGTWYNKLNKSTTTYCVGDVINLGGDGKPYRSYQWKIKPTGDIFTTSKISITAIQGMEIEYYEFNTFYRIGYRDSLKLTVFPWPKPSISGQPIVCSSLKQTYSTRGVNGNSYTWHVKNGEIIGGANSNQVTVAWDTAYKSGEIWVVEKNPLGCADSATKKVTISFKQPLNAGPDISICRGTPFMVSVLKKPNCKYLWRNAENNVIGNNPYVSNTAHENTFVSVEENDTLSGCIQIDTVKITVIAPSAKMSILGRKEVCYRTTSSFWAEAEADRHISWKVKGGILLANSTPTQINVAWNLAPAAAAEVWMYKRSTLSGCTDSAMLKVKINALPAPTTPPVQTICIGQSLMLEKSPRAGSLYAWRDKSSGIYLHGKSPIVSPKRSTTYTVWMLDSATGCSILDSVVVKVNKPAPLKIIGEQIVCMGTPMTFRAQQQEGKLFIWTTDGEPVGLYNSEELKVTWTTPGKHFVKLHSFSENGCVDSAIMYVSTTDGSHPAVKGPAKVCAGLATRYVANDLHNISAEIIGGRLLRQENDTVLYITWDNVGPYSLSVSGTTRAGCEFETAIPVPEVVKSATLQWNAVSRVCDKNSPISIKLENFASNNRISWDAKGGQIITVILHNGVGSELILRPEDEDSIVVIATVNIDEGLCTQVFRHVIYTNPNRNITMRVPMECESRQTRMILDDVPTDASIEWYVNDVPQLAATGNELSRSYSPGRVYKVKAIIYDPDFCPTILEKTFIAKGFLSGNFQNESVCLGKPVVIEAMDASFDYSEWDFGDGSPIVRAGNKPMSYFYKAPGEYVVTITIWQDSTSCSVTRQAIVSVKETATLDWTFEKDARGRIIGRALSNVPDLVWYINGAAAGFGEIVEFPQPDNAAKHIKLVATNELGCSSTLDSVFNYELLKPGALNVHFYPNPFEGGDLYMSLNATLKTGATIYIYNELGQAIWQGRVNAGSYYNEQISLSAGHTMRTAGIYRVVLRSDNGDLLGSKSILRR